MELTERFTEFYQRITANTEILIAVIVGVILCTLVYYTIFRFLIRNNSTYIVWIFVLFSLAFGLIVLLSEKLTGVMYLLFLIAFIIIICVLFSVEIKRIIWSKRKLKLTEVKHGESRSYDEQKVENCISEIIKALQNMSKNDTGAIIVLANGNVPNQIIDSGTRLDSDISSALIESIFFPKTPLHDGAMIIEDTKIVSAGCFLPLSQNPDGISKDLGSRHRAGIGVTENIDVVSLIVSEETGVISVAVGGKITRYADFALLRKTLSEYYWQELESVRK